MSKLLGIGLVALCILLSLEASVYSALVSQYPTLNRGAISSVGVKVCWTQALLDPVTQISWGVLEPSESRVVSPVYVYNEGNHEMWLHIEVGNYSNPSLVNYLHVIWNGEGQVLQPSTWLATSLTLTVSADIHDIDTFSFDLTFIGSTIPFS